ncbi:capsular polysaccharide synthesis protein [Rhizobium sp. BK068]|uniref:capsular polysaccharide synthesis protein n=1 Tax=Rhizobium sp. BK068 TaxID=2512130 RepID=UPI001FDFC405|nr:capsular polysaccharide synthesis protein [Rhizobium sp. BK068]
MRRSFVGKKKFHSANARYAFETMPKKLPRIVWMYWDKPLEQAPPIVRYAVDTWIRKNPSWDVRILSDANAAEFVNVPPPKSNRKIQWRADLIRVALLRDYGGVWVDATTFCVKPLDEWLPPLMESGFFAFPDSYPGRTMGISFLAAEPQNYLVSKWFQLMVRYYSKRGKLRHYFWVMYLFEYIIRTDRKALAIWQATPKLASKGPILLKRILTQPDLLEPIPDYVDTTAITWLKISSDTKLSNQEVTYALESNADIELRKVAETAPQNR